MNILVCQSDTLHNPWQGAVPIATLWLFIPQFLVAVGFITGQVTLHTTITAGSTKPTLSPDKL